MTAIASALTSKRVKPYLAMTGEITLRGQVLPVRVLREKKKYWLPAGRVKRNCVVLAK